MNILTKIFGGKSLSAIARRTGYVRDQIGIQMRFLRENQLWQSHLQNTKQYIADYMSQSNRHGSAAVLGSGWLLDVPIDELAKTYHDVYLFDIVHPEQITVRLRKYPNVHLVVCDLTGGAVELAEQADSFAEFMQKMSSLSLSVDCKEFDAVFSVNVLNQLDILLCDYLADKFGVSEHDLIPVRQKIQQFHIDNLPIGKTCIITDVAEENRTANGTSVEEKNLLYCTFPTGQNQKEWIWNFDSNQTYRSGKNTNMKVIALQF